MIHRASIGVQRGRQEECGMTMRGADAPLRVTIEEEVV
jgi:hypothetical protein